MTPAFIVPTAALPATALFAVALLLVHALGGGGERQLEGALTGAA